MDKERLVATSARFARSVLSNLVATVMPTFYMRAIGESGRGPADETALEVATYHAECFRDYARVLGEAVGSGGDCFNGKRVLEYGPGDFPGTALMMLASGAASVTCVDRFPLLAWSVFNLEMLEKLVQGLPEQGKDAALRAFVDPSRPEKGFNPARLRYQVSASGLSGLRGAVDLVVSRAVLEHVNDLAATFLDIEAALVPGGVAVHQVDLKSHRLHQRNELDFLTWPDWMWKAMFSGKGAPNRLRVDSYRRAIAGTSLDTLLMDPIDLYPAEIIQQVRPQLPTAFAGLSNEELSWKAFWLVQRKREPPSARTPRKMH